MTRRFQRALPLVVFVGLPCIGWAAEAWFRFPATGDAIDFIKSRVLARLDCHDHPTVSVQLEGPSGLTPMNAPYDRGDLLRRLRLSCDAVDDWIAGWEKEINLNEAGQAMLSEARIWRREIVRAIGNLELGKPVTTRMRALAREFPFTLNWGPDITAP